MKKFNLLLILLIFATLQASETNKSIWQEIGENFLLGILQADYRENPVNELLGLKRIPLPHPTLDKVQHPCLLFNQMNRSKILSRKNREPYKTWAEELIQVSNAQIDDTTSLGLTELKRSKIAKLNAFSYFLTNNTFYLAESKKALAHISPTLPQQSPEGGQTDVGWGNWMQAATSLKQYAVAYDLIYHELSAEEQEFITSRLADQTNQMYHSFTRFPSSFDKTDISSGFGIPKNNHIIDISAAVITVAMVLDHPKAQAWLDRAIDELEGGLALISSDGSYREGYYYGEFIASRLYQLSGFLQNMFHENILAIPHIDRFTRWLIDLEKPDGSLQLFDDAFNKHYLYQPMGIGLSPQSRELRFLYEANPDKQRYSDPLYIEVFCNFDDRVKPRKPNFDPLIFYPEGGNAILRGRDDIFGSLLAEPGRPYTTKHDHIEPGAFTLSAFGKDFLIDAGYGLKGVNDENRHWFTSPRAHNIPLVNGLGPNQNPVWGDDIGAKFTSGFGYRNISTVIVEASYRETDIKRTLLFPQQSYFIVIDSLHSENEKWFSIPWHGRGELIRAGRNQLSWNQGNTNLQAEFISLSALRITINSKLDSYKDAQPNRTANIHFPRGNSQKLVSLFLPQSDDSAQIQINELTVDSSHPVVGKKILGDGWSDYLILAESSWKTENLQSDASLTFYHNSDVDYIYLKSASYCRINDELIFQSLHKINLLIYLEPTGWCGLFDLPDTAEIISFPIKLFPHTNPGNLVLDNVLTDYIWNDGVSIILEKDVIFSMGRRPANLIYPKKVRENISVLSQLQSSMEPEQDLENMSKANRTHLRNEILDIVAKTGVDMANSLIGKKKFLEHLYGITMGIFTSMWDAENSIAFKIPQSFYLQRKIGEKFISYREYGNLSDNGISPYYQELIVDNIFRAQLVQDLKNQHELDLEYHKNCYSFFANWERYKALDSYDLEIKQNQQKTNLSVSAGFDEIRKENQQQLRLSKQFYYILLNHYQPWNNAAYNRWIMAGGIRFPKLQNHFVVEVENFENTEKISINLVKKLYAVQSYSLNKYLILSGEVHYTNYEKKKFSFIQTLNHTTDNNFLQISYKNKPNWEVRLMNRFFLHNWRINWQTDIREKSHIKLSARRQTGKMGFGNNFDSSGVYQYNFSYGFIGNFSLNFGQSFDLPKQKLNELVTGFYYESHIQIGNEFRFIQQNNAWLIGYNFLAGFPLTGYDGLNIYYSTNYWDNGNLESYEIGLEQYGRNFSPGVMISRDNREFLRCEGYLTWKFY